MNIVAVTRAHYGCDYIRAVVQSTEGFAEKHAVLYTPVPTFRHSAPVPNPDSEAELHSIASAAGGARLEWLTGLPVEVDTAFKQFPSADIILELDADEVIEPLLCRDIIERYSRGELTARSYRLPLIHFWRSFGYVCRDGNHPPRLYLPHNSGQDGVYYPSGAGHILHFGYARRIVDMEYKIALSAHRDEFRKTWWDDTFMAFPDRLMDLHPISPDFWNAEAYDKTRLPDCLREHPYYQLDKIE